jgi:hypothetical protein
LYACIILGKELSFEEESLSFLSITDEIDTRVLVFFVGFLPEKVKKNWERRQGIEWDRPVEQINTQMLVLSFRSFVPLLVPFPGSEGLTGWICPICV